MENPTEEKNGQHHSTPKWLEKLQNESWQAEILISGGAFVALLAILQSIGGFFSFLIFSTRIRAEILANFSLLVFFGCIYLLIGFFIHLILRGYWIGLIGLNSVFPMGINKEKLAMKGRFSAINGEASNVSAILKIDDLCGQIFALSFLAFFSLSSFVLYLLFVMLIAFGFTYLEWKIAGKIIIIAFLIIGLISLLDFFTFGRLKRIKWLAPVYYPLHYGVSLITLSFLYRRLYYSLASNIKPLYLFLIIAITQAAGVAASYYLEVPSGFAGMLPKNGGLLNAEQMEFLAVKEETVRDGLLEIELQHFIRLEESMLENWKKKHRQASGKISGISDLSPADQKQVLAETYQLFLDGKPVPETDWIFGVQQSDFLSKQIFLRTILEVSQLKNGAHQLSLKIHPANESIRSLLSVSADDPAEASLYFYVYNAGSGENLN